MLEDKIIFLTGGTAGIGLACAEAYVEAGAKVFFLGIDAEEVEATKVLLGTKHWGICADVANEDNMAAAMRAVITRYGRIDVIHNNAGVASPSKPLHSTDETEWNTLMDVNVKSILLTTKYGYPHLKETMGCILNTGSLVGAIGQENHAAYAATKGAINALTKSMAIDYAKDNIRVNSVLPAAVRTATLQHWITEQDNPESMNRFLEDIHVLGYCPYGDVIADACVFLVSDKARFITGVNLPVSGGAELGYRRNINNI